MYCKSCIRFDIDVALPLHEMHMKCQRFVSMQVVVSPIITAMLAFVSFTTELLMCTFSSPFNFYNYRPILISLIITVPRQNNPTLRKTWEREIEEFEIHGSFHTTFHRCIRLLFINQFER
jgi:hypothetical protein